MRIFSPWQHPIAHISRFPDERWINVDEHISHDLAASLFFPEVIKGKSEYIVINVGKKNLLVIFVAWERISWQSLTT